MTGGAAWAGPGQTGAALLCAALAVLLLTGRDVTSRRARLLFAGDGPAGPGKGGLPRGTGGALVRQVRLWWRTRCGGRPGPEAWCLPAGAVLAALGESVLPLIGAAAALPLVRRWLRRRARRRAAERRAAEVIELCGAVAGELRAGRQPGEALQAAAEGGCGGAETTVQGVARLGGDVPEALRRAARRPGAEGLLGVAACWQIAADSGAGLAAGLDRVAAALRAERAQREELHAQLAGARSTAVLLALLPAFGLLMGGALGAEPLRVLLHTPAGLGCLVVGGLLEGAGLAWTARIVRAAVGSTDGGRE